MGADTLYLHTNANPDDAESHPRGADSEPRRMI